MLTRFPRLMLSVLLVASIFAAYWPAMQAGFVDFDDADYVTGNPHVNSGLTTANIHWAFTQYHSSNWHPLTWISHMVDVELFGLAPQGHHVVNVLLHASNSVLLFLVLNYMTGSRLPSFAVAAMFALHPINVESVAWISQRKTTLSTLFGILAIGCYAAYVRQRSWRNFLGSLLLFAGSLMCKQTLVTLPFALLLLDYWPLNRRELCSPANTATRWNVILRGWWKLVPEKMPFLAVAVAASVVTIVVQEQAINTIDKYPLETRLGNVVISYAAYLGKLFYPLYLAAFYPLYQEDIVADRVFPALALLVALTAMACIFGRRWRYLLTGWCWYLGTMLPLVGLIHVGAQSMADRYAYVSFWGLWIILAWGVRDLWHALAPSLAMQRVAALAIIMLSLTIGYLTFEQASKWHDTISLFEDAAQDTQRNWKAHRLLADHYLVQRNLEKSLEHCEAGLACGREVGRLLSTQGRALFDLGRHDEAMQKLLRAAEIDPSDSLIRTNLGWAYGELGQYQLASEQLEQAARMLSNSATPYARQILYANWGNALAKLGETSAAREKFAAALAEAPDDPAILQGAAEVELQAGDFSRALTLLSQAERIRPADLRTVYLQGKAHAGARDDRAAVAAFERVLKEAPQQPDATLQLADVLVRNGQRSQAMTRLSDSLAAVRSVEHPQAKIAGSRLLTKIADISLQESDVAGAIRHYDEAIAIWPENYQALNNLAWMLATVPAVRDGKRAVVLAERAMSLRQSDEYIAWGTLAAAQAANGQMEQASKTASRALALAQASNDLQAVADLQTQIQQYQAKRAFNAK